MAEVKHEENLCYFITIVIMVGLYRGGLGSVRFLVLGNLKGSNKTMDYIHL